jgi:hypothetical protein
MEPIETCRFTLRLLTDFSRPHVPAECDTIFIAHLLAMDNGVLFNSSLTFALHNEELLCFNQPGPAVRRVEAAD